MVHLALNEVLFIALTQEPHQVIVRRAAPKTLDVMDPFFGQDVARLAEVLLQAGGAGFWSAQVKNDTIKHGVLPSIYRSFSPRRTLRLSFRARMYSPSPLANCLCPLSTVRLKSSRWYRGKVFRVRSIR